MWYDKDVGWLIESITDKLKQLKQSEINAIIAIIMSAVINYFVLYKSPFNSLATVFGVDKYLIWIFIWLSLVGAGFALIFLNRMFPVKKKTDE